MRLPVKKPRNLQASPAIIVNNTIDPSLENLGDAVVLCNLDLLVTGWGRSAEKTLGFSAVEVAEKGITDLHLMRMPRQERISMREKLRRFGRWSAEKEIRCRDGRKFFAIVNASLLTKESCEQETVLLLIQDITRIRGRESSLKKHNSELKGKLSAKDRDLAGYPEKYSGTSRNPLPVIPGSNPQKLIEQEHQLQLYIEYSPASIAMFDTRMRYIVASKRWKSDRHIEPVDVVGKFHYEVFPSIPAGWKEIHRRCLEGATDTIEESGFTLNDGTQISLRGEIHPWYRKNGRVGGIIIFTEDITERRQAEKRIRESEQQYHNLVERISDGIIALDTEWKFSYLNRVAEKMFGFRSSYLVGKNIWTEYPVSVHGPFFETYHESLATQQHRQVEAYSEALHMWLRADIYPSPSGLSIYFKDTTREKQLLDEVIEREEQMRLYIKHSPAAIAMFDLKMQYMLASDRWISDYHLEQADILGKSHYEIFPEISREWKAIHRRCLRGAIEKRDEDWFTRGAGETTWIRWEVRPWHLANGNIGGIMIFTEDITARKQAEEALRIGEEKYRTLIERISDGFIALDADWNFIYANKVAEGMYGHTSEKLMGKNMWTVFPHAVDQTFYKAYHEAMRTQQDMQVEGFSLIINRWVHATIYPSLTGVSIFFRDIHDQRKAEVAARQSEELRTKIMGSALDAIVVMDARGNVTQWNQQAVKLFGWNETEIMGQRFECAIIPERYRQQHVRGLEEYLQTGSGPMIRKLTEITAIRRSGAEFPVELFIVPIQEKEAPLFCAFIRDISERKAAESQIQRTRRRLEEAQQIGHLGSWEINLSTGASNWSDEAYRIYGLEPGNHNISVEDWLELIHPDDRETVNAIVAKSFKDFGSSSFYSRTLLKTGEVRHILTKSAFEFDEHGKPVTIYGIAHDVTDIRNLEQELREQQRREQVKLMAATLEAEEKERRIIGS